MKSAVSGVSSVLPVAGRAEAHRLAAELAARHPALVFRNPEKLARAWELQREERRHFIAFFGSDLVVLPGPELPEQMRAYARFRMHEVRDAEGKSAIEHAKETYGVAPPALDFGLPAEMDEVETVGVVFDEIEGLNFWVNFGLLEEAFANPELVTGRRYRQAVLGYLKEPSLSPLPLRRLAERDPERANQAFRRVLKQPGFLWERDGEALLRRHKASNLERPALPSITPLSRPLAQAQLTASTASDARSKRRPPRRRSNRGAARRPGRSR